MNFLFKEEPENYSYDAFVKDGQTTWSGVKNPVAQKNLRSVKRGDRVFYYHTGKEKSVIGIAKAVGDAYPDPKDKTGKAFVVDIAPVKKLARPVTLAEIKAELQGKILIDVTVPLVPPQVGRVQLPEGGSAVLRAQAMLGEGVRVVSAFQNVSAEYLRDLDHPIDCDVLVCGDDRAARAAVIALAAAAGMRAFHAGPLANSAAAEALTSVLVTINRQHKIKHSGIRITGLPDQTPE